MGRTPLAQGLLLVTGADPVGPCDWGVVDRLEPCGRHLFAGLADIVGDVADHAKDPARLHHPRQGPQPLQLGMQIDRGLAELTAISLPTKSPRFDKPTPRSFATSCGIRSLASANRASLS